MRASKNTAGGPFTVLAAVSLFLWGCGGPPVSLQEPPRAPEVVGVVIGASQVPAASEQAPVTDIGTAAMAVHGEASWYCNSNSRRARLSRCRIGYPDRARVADLFAAAGPELRQGDWLGRIVTVERGSRSVRVKLIDFCGCPTRLIDLYADAMWQLGGTGTLDVTVSWEEGAGMRLPPTDTAP